jgi:hypothetical protein
MAVGCPLHLEDRPDGGGVSHGWGLGEEDVAHHPARTARPPEIGPVHVERPEHPHLRGVLPGRITRCPNHQISHVVQDLRRPTLVRRLFPSGLELPAQFLHLAGKDRVDLLVGGALVDGGRAPVPKISHVVTTAGVRS